MKVLASLILITSGAVIIGQTVPAPVTPWATGSAAVTLAGVVGWLLTKTIPSMQKDFKEIVTAMHVTHTERHDRREKTRHEDSVALNETLRQMSATCAARVQQMTEIEAGGK